MANLYKNFIFPQDYVEYCNGVHPALKIPFGDLYKELQKRVKLGYISSSKENNLEIFKYTQETVCERQWDYFTLLARGIVLSPQRVVGLCFPKFFNYNEQISIKDIFEKTFLATEKKDGSLGICFWNNSYWKICTCGSFISEQAQWANNFFQKNINSNYLKKGETYLFEIIYKENKIVVPYLEDSLCLLSAYDINGYELSQNELEIIAKKANFQRPKIFNFDSLDSILKKTEEIDYTQEGFVIRFKNGVRVKMKGDEYCRIHRLISRMTPKAIWEMMLNKDDLDQIKKELPEEMESDFIQIVNIFEKELSKVLLDIENVYNETKHLTDKQLGFEFQKKDSIYFQSLLFEDSKSLLFSYRKGKFQKDLEDKNSQVRKRVFKIFKPYRNQLDGYTPSNSVTRFSH